MKRWASWVRQWLWVGWIHTLFPRSKIWSKACALVFSTIHYPQTQAADLVSLTAWNFDLEVCKSSSRLLPRYFFQFWLCLVRRWCGEFCEVVRWFILRTGDEAHLSILMVCATFAKCWEARCLWLHFYCELLVVMVHMVVDAKGSDRIPFKFSIQLCRQNISSFYPYFLLLSIWPWEPWEPCTSWHGIVLWTKLVVMNGLQW